MVVHRFPMWMLRAGCACVAVMLARSLGAQSSMQTGLSSGQSIAQSQAPSARPITAAEGTRGLLLHEALVRADDDGQRNLRDQLDTALHRRAHDWIVALTGSPAKGIQLDPMGKLYVTAAQDVIARQQFATRLATLGLSADDRAYTLLLAVDAFSADAKNSGRMRIALDYMTQLDAQPASVVVAKFHARLAIARAYFEVGDGTAVETQLRAALKLVPIIPYDRREWLVTQPIGAAFTLLADVLSGRPNGRAQIDSIGAWLLSYTRATSAQIASDSTYARDSEDNERAFKEAIQLVSYLGRQAPAVTAHYWWNTAAPATPSSADSTATSKTLDDGKIRLTQFGHIGCPGCVLALPKIDRLRKTLPSNVEVWYVTFAGSSWGVTACTPREMAQHLRHHYIDEKNYGMAIALWAGGSEPDVDGGVSPKVSPTFEAYPINGYPWFIVTDGHGIVRHVSFGYSESVLTSAIDYLVAEAARSASYMSAPRS